MTDVVVPTSDVNSETGVVVAWKIGRAERVEAGDPLAEIETSKAVLEVVAPAGGLFLPFASEGDEVRLDAPIGKLFDTPEALATFEAERAAKKAEERAAAADGIRVTVKARARALELGVDLASLPSDKLITVKDVEAATTTVDVSTMPLPLSAPDGWERVLLIGGARGATQVIDIFRGRTGQTAVAILDDDSTKWGQSVYGVPIIGGTERMAELYTSGIFDAVVIAISTSVRARTKVREHCESHTIPLTNAIDATSKIATEVQMGVGNVICAFVHIGTSAIVGNNNFISAYNSFEHHNVIGSDISTGPSCVTSSRVKIGDRCRLGTGIFIEPGVELGDEVRVASGSILVRSVPARHTVKTKIVTTTVVPNR